jgi:hypothetical protein
MAMAMALVIGTLTREIATIIVTQEDTRSAQKPPVTASDDD